MYIWLCKILLYINYSTKFIFTSGQIILSFHCEFVKNGTWIIALACNQNTGTVTVFLLKFFSWRTVCDCCPCLYCRRHLIPLVWTYLYELCYITFQETVIYCVTTSNLTCLTFIRQFSAVFFQFFPTLVNTLDLWHLLILHSILPLIFGKIMIYLMVFSLIIGSHFKDLIKSVCNQFF